ncbi:class I tRNA ligase family protein, partial [Microvirga sp. 3-52]|nr:class I tRNA ligase family protein [Microvirga sp. 3-52]
EEKFLIAEDLLSFVAGEIGWEDYTVERVLKGAELERIKAKHPLYDRDSLIMLGDHVTIDAGTGCVHTAPGHGEEDFYVSRTYGIDALNPVDDKGFMTDEAPGFEGLFYEDAN